MNMLSDFHSHILPGIDDGSKTVEESIAMLQAEAEQGVKHVVATPHFYSHQDTMDGFLERRNTAKETLQQTLEAHPGLPRVTCGAEVYYFRGISRADALRKLALEGTQYVMIEMPMGPWTDTMYRELKEIRRNLGLTPIIAHLDRYLGFIGSKKILQNLEDLPVLIQANASFFLHRQTARKAMRMLEQEQIHLLGSDCHNLTSRRPNLDLAVEQIRQRLGESALDRIRRNETLVLSDGACHE